MIIYGINSVVEAIRAGTARKIWLSSRYDRRLAQVLSMAERQGIEVHRVENAMLNKFSKGVANQGIVGEVANPRKHSIEELIVNNSRPTLIVVLDGIEDPQNLGAIARSSEAAAVDAIVHQTRRSAKVGAAATKASAGALAHVKLVPVVNISRALDEIKNLGVWIVGFEAKADIPYYALDMTQPIALVVGAEGKGIRRLVREKCDWLASIPMYGHVSSLNVSVSTGILLFEALRQRTKVG